MHMVFYKCLDQKFNQKLTKQLEVNKTNLKPCLHIRPGLKLTQVVFTGHFSKLTWVEPGLVVFT